MSRPQSEQQVKKYSSDKIVKELNKSVLKKLVQANEAFTNNYDSYHFRLLLHSLGIASNVLCNEIWRMLDLSIISNLESSLVYSILSVLLDVQTFN